MLFTANYYSENSTDLYRISTPEVDFFLTHSTTNLLAKEATCLNDLRVPPSNRLHKLGKNLEGQFSISVNDQWRICFRFIDADVYRHTAMTIDLTTINDHPLPLVIEAFTRSGLHSITFSENDATAKSGYPHAPGERVRCKQQALSLGGTPG
jgi:plasmid maintenance system killer protein